MKLLAPKIAWQFCLRPLGVLLCLFIIQNHAVSQDFPLPVIVGQDTLPWGKIPPQGMEPWLNDYPLSATFFLGPLVFSNEFNLQSSRNTPIEPLLPEYTYLLRRIYLLVQLDTNTFSHEDIKIITGNLLPNQHPLGSDFLLILPDLSPKRYTPNSLRNFDGIHYFPKKEMAFRGWSIEQEISRDMDGKQMGRYIREGTVSKINCSLKDKKGPGSYKLSCQCDSNTQPPKQYIPGYCSCCLFYSLESGPFEAPRDLEFSLEVQVVPPTFSYSTSFDTLSKSRRVLEISQADFLMYNHGDRYALEKIISPTFCKVMQRKVTHIQIWSGPFIQYQFYGISGD